MKTNLGPGRELDKENFVSPPEKRGYQRELVQRCIGSLLSQSKPVVLAAAPGIGKTNMAITIVDRLINSHGANGAVILASGLKSLKVQFADRIAKVRPNFTHSVCGTGLRGPWSEQVLVAIPQNIHRYNLPQVDVLVIDEAHYFYGKAMINSILDKLKPKYVLLLTGSPSRFIQEQIPVVSYSIEEGWRYQDANPQDLVLHKGLVLDIAQSAYTFNPGDYTDSGDFKASIRLTEEATNKTMNSLLEAIHHRLTSQLRDNSYLYAATPSLASWMRLPTGLGPTIIAAHDIAHAGSIHKYLKKKNINVGISVSKSTKDENEGVDDDPDSEELEAFRDGKYEVLVVVNRARLGFDHPDLVNFIDMTLTFNPDLIFQMMCRLIRVAETHNKTKLFMKVVAAKWIEEGYNQLALAAQLCSSDFYRSYDGNWKDIKFQQKGGKPKSQGKGDLDTTEGPKAPSSPKPSAPPQITLEAMIGFNALKHKDGEALQTTRTITMRELMARIGGINFHDPDIKKTRIREFIAKEGRFPQYHSNDPEERGLGQSLNRYCNRKHKCYDSAFRAEMVAAGYGDGGDPVAAKQHVRKFIKKEDRLPRKNSKDPEEMKLYRAIVRYCSPSQTTYDSSFHAEMVALGYGADISAPKKQLIREFIAKEGRCPSSSSKDPVENKLGQSLASYRAPSNNAYDPAFRDEMVAAGYGKAKTSRKPKQTTSGKK